MKIKKLYKLYTSKIISCFNLLRMPEITDMQDLRMSQISPIMAARWLMFIHLEIKGKLSWAVNLKKTAWTFQVWFKAASTQMTGRIWRAFGDERDNSRQKSRFRERKVARKPGMLPQTNLLKRMRSSWQFPFK